MVDAAVVEFRERYGAEPALVVRAPGRVNLIGEHTDYNDGFVMPMAIDRAVWIALRRRDDQMVELYSMDFQERAAFDLAERDCSSSGWIKYVHAMALVLAEEHALNGCEGVIGGDVPIGAGLSSSAAIELAAARAFAALGNIPWDASRMALRAQRAENVWVGVNCGIMDQMISATGKAGHALLLDCRTLQTRHVPIPDGVAVVVLDTATRRGLVDSAYNERRQSCQAAAALLEVAALRDVDAATFAARADRMPELMRKRARHVITENERTLAAADALAAGDVERVGQLMNESHASLQHDFEVSSRELDGIVEIARQQPGCFGARMTGAGFGGCAVALVENSRAAAFAGTVAREYRSAYDLQPNAYVCVAADGAAIFL
jgi:galactokinase